MEDLLGVGVRGFFLNFIYLFFLYFFLGGGGISEIDVKSPPNYGI